MFVGQRQRLMLLLEKDKVLCDFCVSVLIWSSQQRVLWMFVCLFVYSRLSNFSAIRRLSKPRYLAEMTLFSTCPLMVYLEYCRILLVVIFVCHFSPYSTIFQLYDGGQFLLVEERTQIHNTVYLGERPPTFRKKTDKRSHAVTSVRAGFEPTRVGGERPRDMRLMS
jgi:hypothetical protein